MTAEAFVRAIDSYEILRLLRLPYSSHVAEYLADEHAGDVEDWRLLALAAIEARPASDGRHLLSDSGLAALLRLVACPDLFSKTRRILYREFVVPETADDPGGAQ